MQDRTRRALRPSEEVEEDGVLADGFVARLADHIFENPAMLGGLFVMALTAAECEEGIPPAVVSKRKLTRRR